MKDLLSNIRDIVIIAGIYLYFIAWVYVHQYFQLFGISMEALKIDYSSLLVYSYNVITSRLFLTYLLIIAVIVLIAFLIFWLLRRSAIATSLTRFKSNNAMFLRILVLVIIFPLVFQVAQQTAVENYREDRLKTLSLKTIQFIFRKDAEGLTPAVMLDSVLPRTNPFYQDIALLKSDSVQALRLLGESDDYYIVLNQPAVVYLEDKNTGQKKPVLPRGYVYFVDKKDILLTKIILH